MRRIVRLIAVILIVCALWTATLLALPQVNRAAQAPEWRTQLDSYLRFKSGLESRPISVVAASQATLPWEFGRNPSTGAYDDSASYVNDYMARDSVSGDKVAILPAEDVWCVLLERGPAQAGGAARQVVFVLQSQGLYAGHWSVHEGPVAPFTPDFARTLAGIGCRLPLNP